MPSCAVLLGPRKASKSAFMGSEKRVFRVGGRPMMECSAGISAEGGEQRMRISLVYQPDVASSVLHGFWCPPISSCRTR